VFNKGGIIVSRRVKIFQVKENRPQQILIIPMNTIKRLHINGTIQAIKHVFTWHILYDQHVASVSVRKHRKENVKVFMENCLVKFIWQEMRILHAKPLIKHIESIYKDFCFVLNLIQIIINIVTPGYKPNINMELRKTFL
jgi:hypothetical protein